MDLAGRGAAGFDVDGYLGRIGAAGPLAPSAEALAELHQAHVGTTPFENLDILLGRRISLELDALEAKLVGGRRGGYCFEQNTLFRAALEALGFAVTSLAARVRSGATAIRPRTHMLGGDGLVRSIPLAAGPETWVGGVGHRLVVEGDFWVLQGNPDFGWSDLYAFTLEPQHPIDFVMANHFTSTWPESPFLNTLTAQRTLPERRVILRDRELTIRKGGGWRRRPSATRSRFRWPAF